MVVATAGPSSDLPHGLPGLVDAARAAGAPTVVVPTGETDAAIIGTLARAELDRLQASAPERVAVLVSDDPRIVALGTAAGCLPVLVGDRRGGWPVEDGVLRLDDVTSLAPLFDRPPAALLQILRATEGQIRAGHDLAEDRFRLARDGGGRTLVFGAGTIGRQAVRAMRERGLQPDGFLDNDVARHGSIVEGLPVLPPTSISGDRDLVVVAAGNAAAAIEAQVDALGVRHRFNLSELFYVLGARLERELAGHLVAQRLDYLALFTRLADETSRQTLEAVVAHRLTLDTGHLARARVRHQPQWFDRDAIADAEGHVFVDGGAFDGDTIASFRDRFGGRYLHAYGFEPDVALAARAAAQFAGDPRVTVVSKGLSDHAGFMAFAATGATDGYLAEIEGDGDGGPEADKSGVAVEVTRLDDEVSEPVTLLKLDVEGAELAALRGAAGHVSASRPTLAVAVYHRASDIGELPRWIAGQRSGDRLLLRHYTDVAFETVLYAVPEVHEASGR